MAPAAPCSVLHRLNVAVFGLRARHWETYVAAADEPACGRLTRRRNGHFQTGYGAPAFGRGALRDKDYAILQGLRVTTSP